MLISLKLTTFFVLIFVLFVAVTAAFGQKTEPLSYADISTGLKSTPPKGVTREQVIGYLITQVKTRKVDKPLTPDREDDLRQAGATDELIVAIRANSPPLTSPTPTPLTTPTQATPLPTPEPTPLVVVTQKPSPILTPEPKPTQSAESSGPKAGEVRKNSLGMELVFIPPGEFMMGSSDAEIDQIFNECKRQEKDCKRESIASEAPQHKVVIKVGFWMGKYEVTQGQWQAVMGDNPSQFKDCGSDCPVEKVGWAMAQEFLKRLNGKNDGFEYSLPSEAQWEYTARAGTNTMFAFGSFLRPDQANFALPGAKNSSGREPMGGQPMGRQQMGGQRRPPMTREPMTKNSGKTSPVGRYQPNKFGLYDMHGNVWEWVQDIYNSSYNGLPTDGSANISIGESGRRVFRGGSFNDFGYVLRSAGRNSASFGLRDKAIGFRIAARAK